jgi:hypothetical protein
MSISSDTEDSLSSSEEELSSPSPPPVQRGKVMCWCKRCVGMILQHAYIAEEHISYYGRHDSGFPGASSSGQVPISLICDCLIYIRKMHGIHTICKY